MAETLLPSFGFALAVVNVAADAVPYSEESILSDAPAIATLELNAGRAKELGIVAGAKVDW